jgi:hypothetical protein
MWDNGDEGRGFLRKDQIHEEPPEIRAGFIQKVYSILTAQLVLTALIAYPFVTDPACKQFVRHYGFPLVIGVTVLNILFLCFMICPCGCEKNMRTFPTNYLLLGGFTITEGVLVGVVCSFYAVHSVLFAVFATALLVGGLTVFAFCTDTDFTGMGPYLFMGCMCLCVFGFFLMFFPFPFAHKIYCCIGIFLFSMYLVYDTQLIMGGDHECSIGIDDYVFAALQLYIDIVQLFLYILQLFGDRD